MLGRQVELKNPTRDGFVFQGWYTDSEYTNINQVNNTSDFTDDVVLYAKWESNKCEFNGTPVNH
ncbi:InlB B-repeat-containing protein [bacterium]|nr:InlB B-repeat-containing protein [bacterium]